MSITVHPSGNLLFAVRDNGKKLFQFYRDSVTGRAVVWDGPFVGSAVSFDPFRLFIDNPFLPVFVCQEEELSQIKAGDVVTFERLATVRIPSVTALHEADGIDHDEWLVVVRMRDIFRDIEAVKDVSLVKLPKGVVGIHSETLA